MKKIIAALLALTMVVSMAACSESSRGGQDTSSLSDSTSSLSDSSSSSVNDSSETTTTTSSSSSSSAAGSDSSAADPSSQSGGKQTTTVATGTTPPPAAVGIDLKTIAKQIFGAQELTYSGDPEDAFEETADGPAGVYKLYADIKTNKLFDPFDDILDDEGRIAAVKADSQVFVEFNSFEFDNDGDIDSTVDGFLAVTAFNCKDEAQAKQVYSLVFTQDLKDTIAKDNDVTAKEITNDYAIGVYDEHGDTMIVAYYRVGNNVLAAQIYDMQSEVKELKPAGYTKKLDYRAELDKLCKAYGVSKLPSAVK